MALGRHERDMGRMVMLRKYWKGNPVPHAGPVEPPTTQAKRSPPSQDQDPLQSPAAQEEPQQSPKADDAHGIVQEQAPSDNNPHGRGRSNLRCKCGKFASSKCFYQACSLCCRYPPCLAPSHVHLLWPPLPDDS